MQAETKQLQGSLLLKMVSGVLHLDQGNPEKIETDEWARGVSTTLFQHISFQLQLISVWRMVGVSQGEAEKRHSRGWAASP